MQAILDEIYQSVIDGQQKVTIAKVTQALDEGLEPGRNPQRTAWSAPWPRWAACSRRASTSCPKC